MPTTPVKNSNSNINKLGNNIKSSLSSTTSSGIKNNNLMAKQSQSQQGQSQQQQQKSGDMILPAQVPSTISLEESFFDTSETQIHPFPNNETQQHNQHQHQQQQQQHPQNTRASEDDDDHSNLNVINNKSEVKQSSSVAAAAPAPALASATATPLKIINLKQPTTAAVEDEDDELFKSVMKIRKKRQITVKAKVETTSVTSISSADQIRKNSSTTLAVGPRLPSQELAKSVMLPPVKTSKSLKSVTTTASAAKRVRKNIKKRQPNRIRDLKHLHITTKAVFRSKLEVSQTRSYSFPQQFIDDDDYEYGGLNGSLEFRSDETSPKDVFEFYENYDDDAIEDEIEDILEDSLIGNSIQHRPLLKEEESEQFLPLSSVSCLDSLKDREKSDKIKSKTEVGKQKSSSTSITMESLQQEFGSIFINDIFDANQIFDGVALPNDDVENLASLSVDEDEKSEKTRPVVLFQDDTSLSEQLSIDEQVHSQIDQQVQEKTDRTVDSTTSTD